MFLWLQHVFDAGYNSRKFRRVMFVAACFRCVAQQPALAASRGFIRVFPPVGVRSAASASSGDGTVSRLRSTFHPRPFSITTLAMNGSAIALPELGEGVRIAPLPGARFGIEVHGLDLKQDIPPEQAERIREAVHR